jgi:hypothetical protein
MEKTEKSIRFPRVWFGEKKIARGGKKRAVRERFIMEDGRGVAYKKKVAKLKTISLYKYVILG